MALEKDGQVVASESAASVAQNERRQSVGKAEAKLELSDHVFAIAAAVVVASRRKRRDCRGQTGHQRLEKIPGHIDGLFAAGLRSVGLSVAE